MLEDLSETISSNIVGLHLKLANIQVQPEYHVRGYDFISVLSTWPVYLVRACVPVCLLGAAAIVNLRYFDETGPTRINGTRKLNACVHNQTRSVK